MSYKRQPIMNTAKIKRETTSKLRRDNSFHVSKSAQNSKTGSFSWAKMSAAGTSEEDRLSTISSRDGSEEVKRKQSFYIASKRDFGCQTSTELLTSIINMPYLARKRSQRIQRTAAIDDDYTSIKFSPNNSMKVRYQPRLLVEQNQNDCRQRKAVPGSNTNTRRECRSFLFPGYSDSPLSTSDDIENEEDFEYYDSISDLLKAHKITPNYVNEKSPICVNDKSMSTYLNPLGNGNRTINDSVESETDKTNSMDVATPITENSSDAVMLVVGNSTGGNVNTCVAKESEKPSYSFIQTNGTECRTNAIISPNTNTQRHSVCSEVPNSNAFQNSICAKRRSSSPLFTCTPSHLVNLNISDNDNRRRRPSALSQGSSSLSHDGSDVIKKRTEHALTILQPERIENGTDIQTTQHMATEEKSLLEFQNFLRERGVELDMTCVESSEV